VRPIFKIESWFDNNALYSPYIYIYWSRTVSTSEYSVHNSEWCIIMVKSSNVNAGCFLGGGAIIRLLIHSVTSCGIVVDPAIGCAVFNDLAANVKRGETTPSCQGQETTGTKDSLNVSGGSLVERVNIDLCGTRPQLTQMNWPSATSTQQSRPQTLSNKKQVQLPRDLLAKWNATRRGISGGGRQA